ncbi:hypothetical protein KAURM247S_04704 [Kitasatospora aureofaciens]
MMPVSMVLLVVPIALAMVLMATAPSSARRGRRLRAAIVRPDQVRGPRHARTSR